MSGNSQSLFSTSFSFVIASSGASIFPAEFSDVRRFRAGTRFLTRRLPGISEQAVSLDRIVGVSHFKSGNVPSLTAMDP